MQKKIIDLEKVKHGNYSQFTTYYITVLEILKKVKHLYVSTRQIFCISLLHSSVNNPQHIFILSFCFTMFLLTWNLVNKKKASGSHQNALHIKCFPLYSLKNMFNYYEIWFQMGENLLQLIMVLHLQIHC